MLMGMCRNGIAGRSQFHMDSSLYNDLFTPF